MPPKNKKPESEPQKVHADLVVYTRSNKFSLELGDIDVDRIKALNETVIGAFGAMQPTKDFVITDAEGVTYHFNVDNVECVRVNVG